MSIDGNKGVRLCFNKACGVHLYISSFLSVNTNNYTKKERYKELEKMWDSKDIVLYCCDCYKKFENHIKKGDIAWELSSENRVKVK